MGRAKAVGVLNEMLIEMEEAPQDWTGQQNIRPQPSFGSQQSQQSQHTPANHDSSFTSPVPDFVWNDHNQNTIPEVNNRPYESMGAPLNGTVSAKSQFHPNHPAGVTGSPANHSHTSSDATDLTILSEDVNLTKFPPPPAKKSFRGMFSSPKSHVDHTHEDPNSQPVGFHRPNSVSSDGKSLYGSSSGASLLSGPSPEIDPHPQMSNFSASANQRVTNKIPFHESPPAERRKRINNKSKSKATTNVAQGSIASSPRPGLPSKSSSLKFPLLGRSKTLKEDFAGFCEGAYLLQKGLDGMKIRNQSVSMTGQNNYWGCSSSKCCFEGCAVPKKDGHKKVMFGFDEDILEFQGVRYRWSFLAKSHTTISNSKAAGYEYQCVFCIGRGETPFRVKGSKTFLEHVATHQGQTPNQHKMPRFNYVVGRLASPWENFDVNLSDATAMELETMETPAELEAVEPGLPEMEAPLESPVNSPHSTRNLNGHSKTTDGSGLGLFTSNGENSGALDAHSSLTRAELPAMGSERHPTDPKRTVQTAKKINYRTSPSQQHQNGIPSSIPSTTTKEAEDSVPDEPLDKNWSHVRDSLQPLHPAPLFARKPVPASSNHPNPQEQTHPNISDSHHHEQFLSQLDESGDLEITPYDASATDMNNQASLGDRIQGHGSFRKPHGKRVMESRQASLMMSGGPHERSKPESWHPGTKWMD